VTMFTLPLARDEWYLSRGAERAYWIALPVLDAWAAACFLFLVFDYRPIRVVQVYERVGEVGAA